MKRLTIIGVLLLCVIVIIPNAFSVVSTASTSVVINVGLYGTIELSLPNGSTSEEVDLEPVDGISDYLLRLTQGSSGQNDVINFDIFGNMHNKSAVVRTRFIMTIHANGSLFVTCPTSLQLKHVPANGVFFTVLADVWYNGTAAQNIGNNQQKITYLHHVSPISGELVIQFSPGTEDNIWDLTNIPAGTYSKVMTFTVSAV